MVVRDKFSEWLQSETTRQNLASTIFMLPMFGALFAAIILQPTYPLLSTIVFFVGVFSGVGMSYIAQKLEQWEAAKYLAFPRSHWYMGRESKAARDIFVKSHYNLDQVVDFDKFLEETKLPEEEAHRILEKYGEVKAKIEELVEKLPSEWRERIGKMKVYLVEFFPPVVLGELKFDKAIWVLPDEWEKTFAFTSGLQPWFRLMPVDHPQAELAAFYIPSEDAYLDWYGEQVPVAFVMSSTWHYLHGGRLLRPRPEEVAYYINKKLLQENLELQHKMAHIDYYMKAYEEMATNVDKYTLRFFDTVSRIESTIYRESFKVKVIHTIKGNKWLWIMIGVIVILIGLYLTGHLPVRPPSQPINATGGVA